MSHDRRGIATTIPVERRAEAEALGFLPRSSPALPEIDAGLPIAALAALLGRLVAEKDIFVRGTEIVTVDADTGKVRPMKSTRFCGWIEQYCTIKKGSRDRSSFSRETAALILDQDSFLSYLRPLQAVHLVRLPVRRADGSIELLQRGYDVASQIFTAETLEYVPDLPWPDAVKFLVDLVREYPWADLDEGMVLENRNVSVQIMAMVGVSVARCSRRVQSGRW